MKYDVIIIGAGPAGMTAALYAARANLNTLLLERGIPGGQMNNTAEVENYPGFDSILGPDLALKMYDGINQFGVEHGYGNVVEVKDHHDYKEVITDDASYEAKVVIIATGCEHRNLEVPGEAEYSGRGVSYCAVCDGPFFRNKKIIVVGGGDSACSEAIYLSTISNDVSIVHRRDSFRAQKAVVDKMLEKGIKPVYDSVVKKINGSVKVESVTLENVKTGEQTDLLCDAVFVFTGMIPQTDLVDMLPKDEGGYIKTNEEMETLIPGLFATGDVRSKSFRQIVTAVSDGAIAANRAKEIINHK